MRGRVNDASHQLAGQRGPAQAASRVVHSIPGSFLLRGVRLAHGAPMCVGAPAQHELAHVRGQQDSEEQLQQALLPQRVQRVAYSDGSS